jgi:hypothetical protein
MIVVSQWPPDITSQQSVWIETQTYKQDILDVSLRDVLWRKGTMSVGERLSLSHTISRSPPEFMGWPMGREGRDFWWKGTVNLLSYIYALWFVSSLVDSLVLRSLDSLILFLFPNIVIETELRYGGQFWATRKREATFWNDPIKIKHPSLQITSSNQGTSSLPLAKS